MPSSTKPPCSKCSHFFGNRRQCRSARTDQSLFCSRHQKTFQKQVERACWPLHEVQVKQLSTQHESESLLLDVEDSYVVKLWFPTLSVPEVVEGKIYAEVLEPLSYYTPNIVRWYGNFECPEPSSDNGILRKYWEALQKDLTDEDGSSSDSGSDGDLSSASDRDLLSNRGGSRKTAELPSARYIVLDKIAGSTVLKFLGGLKQQDVNVFLEDVFFQLSFALLCFKEYGVMHNDLHVGNVFVEELSGSERLVVHISTGRWHERLVRFKITIFDFDHANVQKTNFNSTSISNPLLEYEEPPLRSLCATQGECNTFRSNFDLYNFTATLYHAAEYTDSILPADVLGAIQAFCTGKLFPEYPLITARTLNAYLTEALDTLKLSRTAKACEAKFDNDKKALPCAPISLGSDNLLPALVFELGQKIEVAPCNFYALPSLTKEL